MGEATGRYWKTQALMGRIPKDAQIVVPMELCAHRSHRGLSGAIKEAHIGIQPISAATAENDIRKPKEATCDGSATKTAMAADPKICHGRRARPRSRVPAAKTTMQMARWVDTGQLTNSP